MLMGEWRERKLDLGRLDEESGDASVTEVAYLCPIPSTSFSQIQERDSSSYKREKE